MSTQIQITPSSANFANTDLTFTGNREHDTAGNTLQISTDGGGFGESFIYMSPTLNEIGTANAYTDYTTRIDHLVSPTGTMQRIAPSGVSIGFGGVDAQARLDIRAEGALSTDIAFRIRNSANNRNLFSILGNGDIEVRTNRVSLNQSTRLSIGGSNADNALDANGYTENTIVGFNNTNIGRRTTIIGSSNTNLNGVNPCTTVGYDNTNRDKGIVVGYSNTLGGIVLGSSNTGGSVGRTAVIGDSNIVSELNGNPTQPMFLLGNGVTIPNNSVVNNCVFLSAGNNSTAPFNTFKNDNLLIGSLTPWTANFDNSSRGVFYTKNGTAPTTLAADSFGMYSFDIVAGNAAPHFRTENGSVIKLYQETTGIAAAAFVSNTSLIVDDSATYGGYTMGQVVAALKTQGLLA